jgi:hypothetical protein
MAYESFGEEGPRARNDAYTGLLAISFFAMVIACLLLLVDWYSYDTSDSPAKRIIKSLPPVKAVAGGPVKDDLGPKPAPKADPKPKEEAKPAAPPAKDDGKGKMEKDDGKAKMPAKDEKKDDK